MIPSTQPPGSITKRDPWGERLECALHRPLRYAQASAKKKLRVKLLEAGAGLAGPPRDPASLASNLSALSLVIEDIHQGSLIVDDIQDSSPTRRGKPSLHAAFGLPLALNAGNFLYFRALKRALSVKLPASRSLSLQKLLVNAMAEAHEGQALDLGVHVDTIPQGEVAIVSRETARAKTGALTRAAFGAGHLLHEGFRPGRQPALLAYGESWGLALQRLDDIGHYVASVRGLVPGGKAFEDFRLGRPTWVWGAAANSLSGSAYSRFRTLAKKAPESAEMQRILLQSGLLAAAAEEVRSDLCVALENLRGAFPGPEAASGLILLETLNELLPQAYDAPTESGASSGRREKI